MRILYLCPRYPWPTITGESVRIAGIIEALERDHQMVLACLAPATAEQAAHAQAHQRTVHWCADTVPGGARLARLALLLPGARATAPADHREKAFAALARRLVAELSPECIVLGNEGLCAGFATDDLPWPRVHLDTHDVQRQRLRSLRAETPVWALRQHLRLSLRAATYGLIEQALFARVGTIWSVSDADGATHRRLAPATMHALVANTAPIPAEANDPLAKTRTVLFVGSFSYGPNERAALWLIGQATRLPSGAILRLAGNGPTPRMRAAAAAHNNVEIHGRFDHPDEVYREAAVVVAPLTSGGGTKIKVLEAFAYGLPCVLTPHAAEGLNLIPGTTAVVAGLPDFMAALAALLPDAARRHSLGAAARRLVRERHSPDSLRAQLRAALGA